MGDVIETHPYHKLCQSIFRNLEACVKSPYLTPSTSTTSSFKFKYIPVENKEWLFLPYHCARECTAFSQKKHVFFLYQNMFQLTEPYKITTTNLGDRRQVHMYSEHSSSFPEDLFKKRKREYKYFF